VLEQLQAGVLQVNPNALGSGANWVPDMSYLSAPFLFKDRAHWQRFMKSDLVKGWYKQIEDKGIAVIGDPAAFLRGPYRVMVSTRPVKTLADLKGVKLRMHPDQLAVDAWSYLGADVRMLNFAEVYDAMNRGLVEAMNAPVGQTESIRVYEVGKFIAEHDEYWQSVVFYANARTWTALSADLKAAVVKAHAETSAFATDLVTSSLDDSIARMRKAGVAFSTMEVGPFVDKMTSFYAEREKTGKLPKGFLEAIERSR
jgi:TRAP-type transport system periplasmic protein